MTVHYSEGSARAVVRNGTVVVLPGPASADVVDALWTALERADGGVAATLGVLAAGGLAETPPFAVVSLAGSDPATTAHVAVRGSGVKVIVTAEGGGAPVEVTGAGVVTWSERVVDAPMSFAITTDEPQADTEYPVQAAVVRASALRRTLVDAPAAPDALVAPAAEKPGAAAFPSFSNRAGSSSAPAERQVSGETIVPGALDVPVIGAGSVPSFPSPSAEPVEKEPEPVLESVPMLGLGVVPGPEAPAEARGAVDESTQFGGGDDDYGHLFGDTVMRRVEDAAVRQGEDEEEHEEEPAQAQAPVPPPPAPAEPEPVALEPADPGDGLISGVPGGWTPPVLAPEPPAGVTPGAAQRAASMGEPAVEAPGEVTDHDGETMMSVDIAALRKEASPVPKFSAAVLPGAQQILGRPCPQGHPNPPTAERCRTCSADLDGDAELVPRPSLGQMIVTGGVQQTPGRPQVVELDRPVIVGRRPRTNNASADRTPRLVTVASPDQDISRSHVEITLEEWHVLVADLATTNGTTLLRAGQAPRRLHPNEKVIVVEGDVVDLGDGATLTFEGIW
ncbi:FHA domain-containing protein [Promicromonospora sp. NPDC060271]|uniref:FHA domain-containing protein n=1 Tax=Promicromonospora sp. NPDC060271 TaxID=3347089 RepID=UPI0036634DF2